MENWHVHGATHAVGPVHPIPPHWPHRCANAVGVAVAKVGVVVDEVDRLVAVAVVGVVLITVVDEVVLTEAEEEVGATLVLLVASAVETSSVLALAPNVGRVVVDVTNVVA